MVVNGHMLAAVGIKPVFVCVCVCACVIAHMGHWADGSEPHGDKKGGREGQNEIQRVWERQREGETEQSRQWGRVMWVEMRGWIESGAILPGCGKRVTWQLQPTAKFKERPYLLFLRFFVKMWIISEDKVRLLFLVGFERGMETDRERDWIPPCGSLLIGLITV